MPPIAVGDTIPDGTLAYFNEEDQMQDVSIHSLASGKKVVIFGVPGAFTPTCSMQHVSSFIERSEELKSKGVEELLLISANDPYVMKAWRKSFVDTKNVKFLADGSASYIHALGLELDLSEKGMGRFAMLVDNLKVVAANIEEGGEFTVSGEDDISFMSSNFGSKMVEPSVISNASFTYVHDYDKFLPLQAVDTHHIVAQRSVMKPIVIYLFAILLVAYAAFLHFKQGKPITTVLWSLLFGLLLIKLLVWRPIVKESVIIMPAFGVQLETHYGSGKISRCFIPVSKILKPVLNERVTPVTCWWCLSLLLRDQDELTLVFKKFHPSLKMLVPIWKALCAATDCKQSSVAFQEEE